MQKAFELIFNGTDFENAPLYDPSNCTSPEECLKIEISLEMINEVHYLQQGFGTILRNYVELSNLESFSSTKSIYDLYLDKVAFGDSDNYCEDWNIDEQKMHKFFTDLSQLIGFDKNEQVSLYELPGMLTYANGDELYLGNMATSAYFSRCKYGLAYDDLRKCKNVWEHYVENILNGSKIGNTKCSQISKDKS